MIFMIRTSWGLLSGRLFIVEMHLLLRNFFHLVLSSKALIQQELALTDRNITNELRDHSISSQRSDFVSVTGDLSVAEYFARGVNGANTNGVVSTFRIEAREFNRLDPFSSDASLLRFNSDSDLTLFSNPALEAVLKESSYLKRRYRKDISLTKGR